MAEVSSEGVRSRQKNNAKPLSAGGVQMIFRKGDCLLTRRASERVPEDREPAAASDANRI